MKFKMNKAHAHTQATLEQRILVFCEIMNSDIFLDVSTLERWERSHTQLSERR
jgi:hypothetical protein